MLAKVIPLRPGLYRRRGIKKKMRPIYLIIQDLNSALVLKRVAKVLGVSEGRCYKYGEHPEGSGEPIPLSRLLKLIAYASSDPRPEVQALVDEMLGHFAPENRKIVHKERLMRLEADLKSLLSGGHAEFRPAETLLICKDCKEPLQVIAGEGGLRYVCRGCAGARA